MINWILATLAIVVINSMSTEGSNREIPDFIQICNRDDPKLSECVKKSVNALKPYLGDGIKEFHVPPMEPLDIGDLTILEGGAGGFTLKTHNLMIYGAKDFIIKKLIAPDFGKRMEFELLLPRLHGEGRYEVFGQLLALPLRGNGRLNGNFTNFKAFVKIQFEVNKIDNVDKIKIKTLDVKIKPGTGRIYLYNLFNGDKTLGDIINETINLNFDAFATELIPPIAKALEKKFFVIGSNIIDGFDYADLFPLTPKTDNKS